MRTDILNIRKKKKAQMQMMETIVVLIFFFMIIILGIVVYSKMQFAKFDEGAGERLQLQAIRVAQLATDLSELQCTKEGEVVPSCIDLYKVLTLTYWQGSDTSYFDEYKSFYFDVFGTSKIDIEEKYPGETPPVSFAIYNKDGDRPSGSTKTVSISIPVILYDPSVSDEFCDIIGHGSCKFGMVKVTYYG